MIKMVPNIVLMSQIISKLLEEMIYHSEQHEFGTSGIPNDHLRII